MPRKATTRHQPATFKEASARLRSSLTTQEQRDLFDAVEAGLAARLDAVRRDIVAAQTSLQSTGG